VNKGIFITFEGGEGAGKSTHIRFLSEVLTEQGHTVLCLREPGGTTLGEELRDIVLDPKNEDMVDEAELLIYEAARAQIVNKVINPALEAGSVVLCDRFYDSTMAYQAYGRGLDRAFVEQANQFATDGLVPDRTILLTCGHAQAGLERATQHIAADRLESAGEDFHARVNKGFMDIAENDPERVRVVESGDLKSMTAAAIFAELSDIFTWMSDDRVVNEELFERLDIRYYGNKHKESSDELPLSENDAEGE